MVRGTLDSMTDSNEKPAVSEQTIRSLDYLGSLLYSDDIDQMRKGISAVNSTEGDPLIRLYRGALRRFTKPLPEIKNPADENEIRRNANVIAINSFLNGSDLMIEMTIERYADSHPNVIRGLLVAAIMQYEIAERVR